MRLSIDISDTEHKAIKSMAALKGITVRDFVLERVFNDGSDTGKSGAELTLQTLRDLRAGKNVIRYKNVEAMMADIWQD